MQWIPAYAGITGGGNDVYGRASLMCPQPERALLNRTRYEGETKKLKCLP
jgi:hypothetical protein